MNLSRAQLALLRSLATRKGREESGLFLVEGVRLCEELLAAGLPVELMAVAEGARDERLDKIVQGAKMAKGAVCEVPPHVLERVSDTVTSQGIVAAARWKDADVREMQFGSRAVVVALDRVSDPGNVGTVIRTAAWFGASAVFLGEGCADLLNPKTVRSTMGGLFHLPVFRDVSLTDAISDLRGRQFAVTAATMDGEPEWATWAADPRSLLVLGSEAHGVSPEVARLIDRHIAIPRRGRGESLNVAVAAGILLAAAPK